MNPGTREPVKVLVSDTSVLIDLERGSFLEAAFRLPFEFVVPDLLYKRELAPYGGQALLARGLRVEALTDLELARAQAVRQQLKILSLPDAFAFALAASRGWALLTGDGPLRALANRDGLPFHGVLWLLDGMLEHKCGGAQLLVTGLEAIAAHPRCRLPKPEISVRLTRFRALL
jgi:hypothetical protein